MSQYKNIASINQNRLFAGIAPESLKINLKQGSFLEFQEGDIIYQKGDKDDSIYLIIDGEIKQKIKQPLTGTSVMRKGRNDFFGENEFLAKTSRTSSAVANTNCILFKLNRKDIIAVASEHKPVLKNLSSDENFLELENREQKDVEEDTASEIPDAPQENDILPDFSGLEDPDKIAGIDEEQIDWEEQSFDNLNDFAETKPDEQIENTEALTGSETEEHIQWENTELNDIENLTDEHLKDLSEETDTFAADIEGGEDLKWNENQTDDIDNLTDEKMNGITETAETPETDIEGDEDISWDNNLTEEVGGLAGENLNDIHEEAETSETDIEGDEDIRWGENQTEDLGNLADEKPNQIEEVPETSETGIEGDEDIKWDNNLTEEVGGLADENLNDIPEEAETSETGIEGDENNRWGENQIDNLDNLTGERLHDVPEETGNLDNNESGPEVYQTEEDKNESIEQLDEETSAEYDSGITAESDYTNENTSDDVENMDENRLEEQEEELKTDETVSEDAYSYADETTEDSGYRDEEKYSNSANDPETAYGETDDEINSEAAEKENNYDVYQGNLDITNADKVPEESASINNEVPADDSGIEEKPVIGIYDTGEPDSTKTLSDTEIYERAFRDLLYLYRGKNLPDTLVTINELIKNFTGAKLVNFYLVDTPNNEMDLIQVEDNIVVHRKTGVSEGVTGASVMNNEIISLQNPEEDTRFNTATDSFGGIEINDILCFPVNNNINEVIALFYLANCINGAFSEKDQKYLQVFSEHALNHINNIEQLEKIPANIQTQATAKFTNFVVEDIKTPLMIIKHYADFIKRKAVPEEIRLVSSYMLNQVDSVLTFSSVVSDLINDNLTLNPEKFKLNELLDEILEMLAEYVDTRKVKLFKRYDSTASVNIDKARFYHALYQLTKILCSNMPNGGSIYLITSLKNNNIEISLKDTGTGLPEDTGNILSKQFSDLGSIDELSMELSIAKKIIEDHGGRLELKKNTGNGTEFIIFLQVSESDFS